MSRPFGTADELERRRKRAVQAVVAGESRKTVATVLGVHPKTVAAWVRRSRTPGGLDAKPQPGPTPGLTAADLLRLEDLLTKGAKAHGWANDLWTAARVARLIERHFGRRYHPEHVRKVLTRRLGWTSQKPRRKARERDDKEVARWVGDEFPRIVRQAFRRTAHIVFLDESGFFLTPTVRRTLAPRGKTPVLAAWDRRDRLSAISALTVSPVSARPNLYFEVFDHTVRAEQVVAFLADLHRRLGSVTVVWDRGAIHDKSAAVRAWLAEHLGVVTEKFPGYAPDLNPDEGVWGWTKYGRLANLAANDTGELWDNVIEELVTAKHRPELLRGFIRHTELPGLSLAA
jgi:transposase